MQMLTYGSPLLVQNFRYLSRCAALLIACASMISTPPARAVEPLGNDRGGAIYERLCAECHGPSGEGVEGFTGPLLGDKSLAQLTRYIDQSMPQGAPEQCVGEDAQRVAAYIHEEFYSPAAQSRGGPERPELSRLTVRQYRNCLTDLIGSFRSAESCGEQEGLVARFYNRERPRREPEVDRIDSQVAFHYGPQQLPPEALDKIKGFSARWTGSVVAPETGQYEFVIRSNHGVRLWVNDLDQPLIDGWVQSGDQTRHVGSIYLFGGRAYPLRLEFSSRQQGVDDKKKFGKDAQDAFLELRWKPPHSVEQIVPARHLRSSQMPEQFVVPTPFPPDDRSHGYVRGISVSQAWEEATTKGAIEAAGYLVAHLKELSGVSNDDPQRKEKLEEFCRQFVERAFRGPLSEEQAEMYIGRRFARAPDIETAVKRVALLTLKSPRFLFVDLDHEQPLSYRVAATLSLSLWDSLPDQTLREAASAGNLVSPDEIREHAERMIRDARAHSKLRSFLHSWLELEHHGDLQKDGEKYPEFDEQLIADLRTSLDLFLEEEIWSPGGDFRKLLRSSEIYLNGRLAKFYGYPLPADAPFQKVKVKHSQRSGVLSHPYLMAAFAYTDYSSPIHRGVFLVRKVLGRNLRPPPEAFTPVSPDLHPDMTTRRRVAMQTKPATCQACHSMINSVGFTLEHFDAVGRFRETEKGKPIEASGAYESTTGQRQSFEDARDLAEFLAASRQTHRSFALQLFNYLLKQPVRAYGDETAADMEQKFKQHGYNVPRMMAEIAVKAAQHTLESSG